MKKLTAILFMAMFLTLAACGGSSVSAGDTIEFGGSGWRVLEVDGNRALLLHETVISSRQYHHTNAAVTWEASSLREWLNGSFYNDTFTAEERARIAETSIENNNNPWFDTDGGNTTHDKIFLLSLEEVMRYFGDSGQLTNRPEGEGWIDDAFNTARRAYNAEGVSSRWWLRSPGRRNYMAAHVTTAGIVGVVGNLFPNVADYGGVRPALWLNLSM